MPRRLEEFILALSVGRCFRACRKAIAELNWEILDDTETEGKIAERREALCPGREWRRMFVHGDIKYREELDLIADRGVELKDIREVLEELRDRKLTPFATSSEASDIAALIDFYCKDL